MTSQRHPKISLCAIVKNESSFIVDFVNQAKPYVDEFVIVDTGSTDDTVELLRSQGIEAFHFEWKNDFSLARNYSLSLAKGDWILVLDADERIAPEAWEFIRKTAFANLHSSYEFRQVNYVREQHVVGFLPNHLAYAEFADYPGFTESWLVRFFRNETTFRFQGVVHEMLCENGSLIHAPHLPIDLHHHGQALSMDLMQKKKEHYLFLGREKTSMNPSDAKAHQELGIALWEMGRFAEAEIELSKACELAPSDTKNLISLASVLQKQKKFEEAELRFGQLIAGYPQDSFAHAGLAGCYFQQGRYYEALAEIKIQIEMHPQVEIGRVWLTQIYQAIRSANPSFPASLSVCYIVKNEVDCLEKSLRNVRPYVEEIIVLDTGSVDGTPELAKSLGAKIRHAKWRDDFSWARNESLKHATSEWILVLDADEVLSDLDWVNLKRLLENPTAQHYFLVQTTYSDQSTILNWKPNQLNLKESEGFKGYFESPLVRLIKNTPDIRFEGAVHEHAHHSNAVFQPFMTSIRIHHYGKFRSDEKMHDKYQLYRKIGEKKLNDMPKEPHAYYELAIQLMELGENEGVEDYFKKTLELDGNHVDGRIGYACFLFSQKRYPESLEQFSAAIALRPKDFQAYVFTASLLIEIEKYTLAEQMLNTAKELGAETSVAYFMNLGVLYLRLDQMDLARDTFLKAHHLNSDFVPVLMNLASVETLVKNYELAKKYLEHAIQVAPQELVARQKKAEILFLEGKRQESLDCFLQIHHLSPKTPDYIAQVILVAHAVKKMDLVLEYEKKFMLLNSHDSFQKSFSKILETYQKQKDLDGVNRLSSYYSDSKLVSS